MDHVVDEILDRADLGDHQGSLLGSDPDYDLDAHAHLKAVPADHGEWVKELEPLDLLPLSDILRRCVLFSPINREVRRRNDVGDVGPTVQVIDSGPGYIGLDAAVTGRHDVAFLAMTQ